MAFKHSRMPLIFFMQANPSVKLDPEDAEKYAVNEAAFDPYGYVTIKIDGVRKKLHRVVMGEPEGIVDHENRDTRDCRKCNLRVTSQHGNLGNSVMKSTNTSGYKGVFWHKGAKKWMAQIMVNGKSKYLGLHATKELAAMKYNEAALQYFGEFARLNVLVE